MDNDNEGIKGSVDDKGRTIDHGRRRQLQAEDGDELSRPEGEEGAKEKTARSNEKGLSDKQQINDAEYENQELKRKESLKQQEQSPHRKQLQSDADDEDGHRRQVEDDNVAESDSSADEEPEMQLDSDLEHDAMHAELIEEEGSDIFDTDSSCDGAGEEEDGRAKLGGEQTLKLDGDVMVDDGNGKTGEAAKEDEEAATSKEEMGGVLVYDSYAKMKGCTKIEEYFAQNPPQKVSTDTLFNKAESKEVSKELFGDKARERDFGCDQDKYFFKNLPRFQTQRDFSNLSASLPIPNQQNVLIFDSRFENGNLRKAAKVNNIEYNLWLENDLNTKGHTQWYYFKVIHKDITLHAEKKSHKVKFNVLNLGKTSSLYQTGMKPCIWSKNKHEKEGAGWFRGGDNITYV